MDRGVIHVVQTGTLTGNETVIRGQNLSAFFRRRRDFRFPAQFFVLERPEGLVAIDTGLDSRVRVPRFLERMAPVPDCEPGEEAGPKLDALGIAPGDVRTVILTHLDWDHVGGISHFPAADVHVTRADHDFATSLVGRGRCRPDLWPDSFSPHLYDLGSEPLGPFDQSATIPGLEGIRVVPLPGHSPGQVGVLVETGDHEIIFCGDHTMSMAAFEADWAAGRHRAAIGYFAPKAGVDTTRRLHEFLEPEHRIGVPSHDPAAAERLASFA